MSKNLIRFFLFLIIVSKISGVRKFNVGTELLVGWTEKAKEKFTETEDNKSLRYNVMSCNEAVYNIVKNKKIILIAGYPGAGKTYLANFILNNLTNYCYIFQDTIKEKIFDENGFDNIEEKKH